MAFQDPSYEIECRKELASRINSQKLHPSTKSLISAHPSIVLCYMNDYSDDLAIKGLNEAFKSYECPSFKDMRNSIESLL